MNIDKTVLKVLKEHGGSADDCWEMKVGGKVAHIISHKAVQRIAVNAGIKFDPPVILELSLKEKLAAILLTCHMGERSVHGVGESAPYNTKMGYPLAMASKRAYDRAALEMLGLHAHLYSDEEADAFKKDNNPPKAGARETYKALIEEVRAIENTKALESWMKDNVDRFHALPEGFKKHARDDYANHMASLLEKAVPGSKTSVSNIEDEVTKETVDVE